MKIHQTKTSWVNLKRRQLICGAGASLALPIGMGIANSAFAQSGAYPNKTIRLIVGYAPGGSSDTSARMIADALSQSLGQAVVVENQPGAGGNIAAQNVARAAPDGYTLLLGNTGEISVNKYLNKSSTFDPAVSLVPVGMTYNITHALSVPTKSPYRTLEQLLADARERPDRVRYASAGVGTPGHLAGEMLAIKSRTVLVHIPYKGGGQVLADLLGGELECHISAVSTAVTNANNGAVRILAVASNQRVKALPNVPTFAEAGIANFDFPLWGGILAPAKVPQQMVNQLNAELGKAYARPEIQAKLAAMYSEVPALSPAQFEQFLKADAARYRDIINATGIVVQ